RRPRSSELLRVEKGPAWRPAPGTSFAAGALEHAEGALVGFVRCLLGTLGSGQGLVSLAVGFVGGGLGAGSSVFVGGQARGGFLAVLVAGTTCKQQGRQRQSGQLHQGFHRDTPSISHRVTGPGRSLNIDILP